jgi:hypothetical protein
MKRILNDILRGGVSRRNERGRDAKSHASTTSTVIVFLTVLLMALSSSFNASAAINVSLVPPSGTGTGAVEINAEYGYTVAPVVSFTIVNNDQVAGTGQFYIAVRDGWAAFYYFSLDNGQTWKDGGAAVEITDLAAAGQLTLKVKPKFGLNVTGGQSGVYPVLVQLQDAGENALKVGLDDQKKEIRFQVTKKEITVPDGAITADKQYNNNKDINYDRIVFPALSAQYGIVSGDVGNVSLIRIGSTVVDGRTSADVGTQLVDYSAITLTGAAAGNYTLKTPVKIAATIKPREIKIKPGSITAKREYDGTKIITSDKIASFAATINSNGGGIDDSYLVAEWGVKNYDGGNLVLELESGSQGDLSSPNVTSAENVTFSPGFKLTGSKKDNYKLLIQPEVTVTITKKNIAYSTTATVKEKTYDKTAAGKLESIAFTGIVSGETLVAGTDYDAIVTFTDANAGENKSVKISGIALKPTGKASNYNLTSSGVIDITTGKILPAGITVTGITATKVYDGYADFTTAEINTSSVALAGNLDGSDLSIDASNISGELPDADAVMNSDKVTFSGIALTGTAKANYKLESVKGLASITQATLPIGNLVSNIKDLSKPYNAEARKVEIALESGEAIDFNYTLSYKNTKDGTVSSNPPVNAGTYIVEVNIDRGANYTPILPVTFNEKLVIDKAKPTVDDLAYDRDIDGVLGKYFYSGSPVDFKSETKLIAPRTGLGKTDKLKYNGSYTLPTDIGTYKVTVDIAAGDNYVGIKDLVLGYILVTDAATPAIVRQVKIIGSEYFTSSRTDSFLVNSGGNLTFTLTPVKPLPEGQELKVSTNRHIIADDEGGLTVTANPDGTYTVFIPQIKEAVEVTISTVATTIGTGSEVVSDAARVWSSGGQLTIAAGADSGQASIYAVSGVLVKTVPYAAGETVQTTLPTGIYVAVAGNRVFKVVINN